MSITILGINITPTMERALLRPDANKAWEDGWVTTQTMNRLCEAGLWRRYKDEYRETKRGSQVARALKLHTNPRAMAAHLADIGEALDTRAHQETKGGHPDGDPFAYRKALRDFINRCLHEAKS